MTVHSSAETITAKAAVAQIAAIFVQPQFADKALNLRHTCHDRLLPQEGSADRQSSEGAWKVSLTSLSLIIWSGGKGGWQESDEEEKNTRQS